jgi:hypothetical protein
LDTLEYSWKVCKYLREVRIGNFPQEIDIAIKISTMLRERTAQKYIRIWCCHEELVAQALDQFCAR